MVGPIEEGTPRPIQIPEFLIGSQKKEAIQWMNGAADMAKMALCHRAKCGTVIVKNGEVIGQGYNAPPLDKEENKICDMEPSPGKPNYDKTCCMHAEWRAIMDALRQNPEKLEGSKLYFTRVDDNGNIKKSGEPFCTTCSRMALDVGVRKFVLWHESGIREYPTDLYNQLSYRYIPKA